MRLQEALGCEFVTRSEFVARNWCGLFFLHGQWLAVKTIWTIWPTLPKFLA